MLNYNEFISQIKTSEDIKKILKENSGLKKNKDFFLKLLKEKKLVDDSVIFFDKSISEDKELVLKLVNTWPLHLLVNISLFLI